MAYNSPHCIQGRTTSRIVKVITFQLHTFSTDDFTVGSSEFLLMKIGVLSYCVEKTFVLQLF